MMDHMERTTMSVREMGDLLGLKKTEAYRLAGMRQFDIVQVNGTMRVVIASFEEWYKGQIRYHKVDGPPPGERLLAETYSVSEISALLAVSKATVYELIRREKIETFEVNAIRRVSKRSFEEWYVSQSRYRLTEDREREREAREQSLTQAEAARLLGISPKAFYNLIASEPDSFEFIELEGHRRITKDSFERWYEGQTRYVKITDRPALSEKEAHQRRIEREKKKIPRLEIDPDKPSYSVQETAVLLAVDIREVYRLIGSGELEAKRYGHVMRVAREEIDWWLSQQRMHMDTC